MYTISLYFSENSAFLQNLIGKCILKYGSNKYFERDHPRAVVQRYA
jgi:hypothetical protein